MVASGCCVSVDCYARMSFVDITSTHLRFPPPEKIGYSRLFCELNNYLWPVKR